MARKTAAANAEPASQAAIMSRPGTTYGPVCSSPVGKLLSQDAIRLRAYQKWEAAGRPGGDGLRFWLDAERELLSMK